ncbi:hypothetical protein CEXT_171411 [Caerostris extrusa]|uniref:Uncharacterized protein n=1 Tax=Caerostris extrusa TaxID=172846 RepID=A0AAV4NNZ0_CAEEX|nr:hypothetical protein CEXT_171411 [Caerostris extrusa]
MEEMRAIINVGKIDWHGKERINVKNGLFSCHALEEIELALILLPRFFVHLHWINSVHNWRLKEIKGEKKEKKKQKNEVADTDSSGERKKNGGNESNYYVGKIDWHGKERINVKSSLFSCHALKEIELALILLPRIFVHLYWTNSVHNWRLKHITTEHKKHLSTWEWELFLRDNALVTRHSNFPMDVSIADNTTKGISPDANLPSC